MRNDVEFDVPKEWRNNIAHKPIIFDLLEDFMYFCVFYPFTAMILYYIEKSGIGYVHAMLILPLFLMQTFVRRFTKKILVFFLMQAVIFTTMLFIPVSIVVKLVLMAAMVLDAIYSFCKMSNELKSKELDFNRNRKDETYNRFLSWYAPIGSVVMLYAVYLFALLKNQKVIIAISFCAFILFLVSYQIYVHTSGVTALREWEQGGQSSPSKNFTVFFSVLLAAGLGVFSYIIYQIVYLTGLYRLDYAILNYLQHGRQVKLGTPKLDDVKKIVRESEPKMNLGSLTKGMKQSGVFAKALNVIIFLIAAVILIIMIAVFLRWVFMMLKKLQKYKNEETQSVFSLSETKKNLTKRVRSLTDIFNIFQGTTNSVKIRKLYYKAIEKFSRSGSEIFESDTPAEIGEKVKDKAHGDIWAATDLYEKARYAGEDCTPEDVKAARLYLEGSKGR